ncbi:MAG TPA: Rieske 2Fe-2S domain-containing protein [Thermoanaerobaculia bacterium]|nr:Rieske 2Fe-2S domain-containing protein [Thermoanaerobaculia bacterium]
MEFIDIANTTELPIGRAKAYDVNGRTIALYHTEEGFFATDNTCPHRGGPLAEGDLIGNEINCPWHLWGFDVKTGLCPGNREFRVTAHEVRIENDRVMVRLAS